MAYLSCWLRLKKKTGTCRPPWDVNRIVIRLGKVRLLNEDNKFYRTRSDTGKENLDCPARRKAVAPDIFTG